MNRLLQSHFSFLMFRYSFNRTIYELKSITPCELTNKVSSISPSNCILPDSNAPIIFENQIQIGNWGIPANNSNITTCIPRIEFINIQTGLTRCLIPITGVFVADEYNCLYAPSNNNEIMFAAGVVTPSLQFAFITKQKFCILHELKELPILLQGDNITNWVQGNIDLDSIPDTTLTFHQISRLSLNNNLYNGDRCIEKIVPFKTYTKCMQYTKELLEQVFPEPPEWFDRE